MQWQRASEGLDPKSDPSSLFFHPRHIDPPGQKMRIYRGVDEGVGRSALEKALVEPGGDGVDWSAVERLL